MKIAIGNDHAALQAKELVLNWLREQGHEVQDFGAGDATSVDYPDFAHEVAQGVAQGKVAFGVLLCGTGIGMSIAANRHAGVRAALCHSAETARMTRLHNDANVLCLGARVLDDAAIRACLESFFGTEFEGGRHARRVSKIELPGMRAATGEAQEKEL